MAFFVIIPRFKWVRIAGYNVIETHTHTHIHTRTNIKISQRYFGLNIIPYLVE